MRRSFSMAVVALLLVLTLLPLGGKSFAMFSDTASRDSVRSASGATVKDEREVMNVVLKHADVIQHDQLLHPDVQCLIGNVEFHHRGLVLFCDSAALNQGANSFKAYHNVRMLQGDTLSLTSDSLFYDGMTEIAQARANVVLVHKETTLFTDSLNYDNVFKLAYFFEGGLLVNGNDRLSSDWGEYNTETRMSTFNFQVKLESDDFILTTDTLHYNADTRWAETEGPSEILSGENRIDTEKGLYNTEQGIARLTNRPVLYNKGMQFSGDSISYNKNTGLIESYRNISFQDTASKSALLGEYGEYNEHTGLAMATGRALAKEYSDGDTLYLHADTLRLFSHNHQTDSAYRIVRGYPHVRAFRSDVQAVCDTLIFNSKERRMFLRLDPIVWSESRQIVGEEIIVCSNDSTIDSILVERQALIAEFVDSAHFNQVSGQRMKAYFFDGKLTRANVDGNVCVINFPLERDSTILYMNRTETSYLRMYMSDGKLNKLVGLPEARGRFVPVKLLNKGEDVLEGFSWFDYIRPLSPLDLFEWRGKRAGTELKPSLRREAPLQKLDN